MNDTTDVSDPVRRGLVAYAETIAERDRLRRELDDVKLALSQEQAKSAGLENELRRAEIHRDEARVERDAAIRSTAKYETFFEAQQAMMRDFRPTPPEFTAMPGLPIMGTNYVEGPGRIVNGPTSAGNTPPTQEPAP